MKDCHRTPIIINLGECLSERTDIAKVVKKRFETIKSSVRKCKPLGYNSRKNNNIYMLSECDDVLKNDFKWLINFNLKEMLHMHDIDEELPGRKLLTKQRNRNRRNKFGQHKHRISLADVIVQCLFAKDEATIKEINKWISAAFPCFQSNGCAWKNSVRKTLLNNPIFKKRKLGKSHLWCLGDDYLSSIKAISPQTAKSSTSEYDLIKSGSSREFTSAVQSMQENISSDEKAPTTSNISDVPESIADMHLPITWIECRELREKRHEEVKDENLIEYYETPAEFQVGSEETVEVHYLDENMMIPIDFILKTID